MSASKLVASTVIALASLAAGSAFAEGGMGFNEQITPTTSGLTRAQVMAEAAQARKEGSLIQSNGHNYPAEVVKSTQGGKTRAEVKAEYSSARAAGTIPQYRS